MKRELKFRAWDIHRKLMYDPMPIIDFELIRINAVVLMQYTGLKDKNGKEIYEGDIGEIKTQSGRIERFTVEWGIHRRDMKSGWTVDIPSFAFMVDGKATFPISNNYLNGHDLDIIEIIGNIYENPEPIN